jgi:hypothetical protein
MNGPPGPGERWLLVTVSAAGSSTLRVYAWRTLRSLGALYLQNSVALLPDRDATVRRVNRLLDRLRRQGGDGSLLHIEITDEVEVHAVVERFRAERADEYGEICSRTPAFLEEIAMERSRGRVTYGEVEESEADLARLRAWLDRVRSRDYFGAPGRAEAEAAVERCAAELATFEAEAYAAELPGETGGVGRPHLRAIDGDQTG